MLKRIGLLLLPALLAAPVFAGTAMIAQAGDNLCLDRSRMVDALVDKYGEQLAEVHQVKGRGLLEFHVSPSDGTWTALITEEGVSCVLATGEGLPPRSFDQILNTGMEI